MGMWREYLPCQGSLDVSPLAAIIYAAASYSLFRVDTAPKEPERISKVPGLSEKRISTIMYDPSSHKLFVAYNNSNIDVLDANPKEKGVG